MTNKQKADRIYVQSLSVITMGFSKSNNINQPFNRIIFVDYNAWNMITLKGWLHLRVILQSGFYCKYILKNRREDKIFVLTIRMWE